MMLSSSLLDCPGHGCRVKANPLRGRFASLDTSRARCVPDEERSASARLLIPSAIILSRSDVRCWQISAARVVLWPIRSMSSRRLGPNGARRTSAAIRRVARTE